MGLYSDGSQGDVSTALIMIPLLDWYGRANQMYPLFLMEIKATDARLLTYQNATLASEKPGQPQVIPHQLQNFEQCRYSKKFIHLLLFLTFTDRHVQNAAVTPLVMLLNLMSSDSSDFINLICLCLHTFIQ